MLLLLPTGEACPGPPQPQELGAPLVVNQKLYLNGATSLNALFIQCTSTGALVNLLSRSEACFIASSSGSPPVKLARCKQHELQFDDELVFAELGDLAPSDNPKVSFMLTRASTEGCVQSQEQVR